MGEVHPFPAALRHEYDPAALNRSQRVRRARRLYHALCTAGLWRAEARLLDVGCGSGLLLAAFGRDVQRRIGCDVRRDLYMRVNEQVGNVLFAQADGTRLPFRNGSFDLVTCLAVIGEFVDWQGALQEMARCVAPGGVLYVTVTNGQLLMSLYTWAERVGIRVRASAWEYSRASARLATGRPEDGFGVPTLSTWRYVHLTPYLARSQWPWLRMFPWSLLNGLLRRFAPSFGFAWQPPLRHMDTTHTAPNKEPRIRY